MLVFHTFFLLDKSFPAKIIRAWASIIVMTSSVVIAAPISFVLMFSRPVVSFMSEGSCNGKPYITRLFASFNLLGKSSQNKYLLWAPSLVYIEEYSGFKTHLI